MTGDEGEWPSLASADLPPALRLALQGVADRVARRWAGLVGVQLVEELVLSSYRGLAEGSRLHGFLPLFTERFANARLRAITSTRAGVHTDDRPAVLFLSAADSGRGQLALAWTRALAGERVHAWSAGLRPASQVHAVVAQVMAEHGLNPATAYPKPWTQEVNRAADVVVSLGVGDATPVFPGTRYLTWQVPSVRGADVVVVRRLSRLIAHEVWLLLTELGVEVDEPAVVGDTSG